MFAKFISVLFGSITDLSLFYVEKKGHAQTPLLRIPGVGAPVMYELCIRNAQSENKERSRNIQLSVHH
jgi:hypothetical protein